MFTVRTVTAGDPSKSANTRDSKYDTKREALEYIGSLGKLSTIAKIDKTYIVTPTKK